MPSKVYCRGFRLKPNARLWLRVLRGADRNAELRNTAEWLAVNITFTRPILSWRNAECPAGSDAPGQTSLATDG